MPQRESCTREQMLAAIEITTASLGKLAADEMNETAGLTVPQGLTEAQFAQLSSARA